MGHYLFCIKNTKRSIMIKRRKRYTVSRNSPKGGKRGCLCEDNTYSSKCCDGSHQGQGIGNITGTQE